MVSLTDGDLNIRVRSVAVTDDELGWTGAGLRCRWRGIRDCSERCRINGRGGKLPGPGMGFIGPIWMRI